MSSTSMIMVFSLLFVSVTSQNPCINHTTINNPYRSINFIIKPGDYKICDRSLLSGWYRFTSIVGGKMPETKAQPYSCGTFAPIWIRGTHPKNETEEKSVTACTNVKNLNYGCYRTQPVTIRHCGSFFVYYLMPSFGCSMAYCAGKLITYIRYMI